MCAAIQSNKNWTSGNTSVITEDNISKVYLHGNHIATIEGVFQKNFKWYVSRFVGQAGQSKVYNADDFVNGYVFS